MVSFIARLLRGERLKEPVLTPPGFDAPRLPAVDSPEITDSSATAALDLGKLSPINRALVIEYLDREGDASIRRIRLIEVFGAKGRVYLKSYCLERQAPRLFRLDRVTSVFCGVTGEDLGDPFEALPPRVMDDSMLPGGNRAVRTRPVVAEETEDLRRMRAALRVLMTIARADGRVHRVEEQLIAEFIEAMWRSDENRDGLLMEAFHMAPSFEAFLDACEQVFSVHDELALGVINAAAPLCQADGDVADAEIEVLKDLAMVARSYDLPVVLEISDAR